MEAWKYNSGVIAEINEKLEHPFIVQQAHIVSLLAKYPDVVRDCPCHSTQIADHTVVCGASLNKQAKYLTHQTQRTVVQNELKTVLDTCLFEKSLTSWTNICLLSNL